jgi:peptidyl-prolyl cis-trans isomerase D
MFEFVRNHNRLFQIILIVLIFPSFVVFGIQGYEKFSGSHAVAKVAGTEITAEQLDTAHRQQIERLRAQMPNVDVKLFDTPEMKQRTLDELVRDRVLFEAARKLVLAPTDEQLVRTFRTDPQFAGLRNDDGSVRKELLAARGMSSEQFVQQLKQDLAMRQVMSGIGLTVPTYERVAQTALDALYQQREVRLAHFDAKAFRDKVAVSPQEVEAYYNDAAHAAALTRPESIDVEYVVFNLAAVQGKTTVSEDDLRKYYDENKARYTSPEERHARHILIAAGQDASADARAKAKAKAEALLQQLKAKPGDFAAVARKESQDPGSTAQGGDLDWFGRGAMTKPFEDAAFALKKGELSGVVQSDFGFHIIEVLDVRGGQGRPFEAVKAELETEVKAQLARQRFAAEAEQFTDAVDQDDTLAPVAQKFGLKLQSASNVLRGGQAAAAPQLGNPKLLEALFQPDSLSKNRNVPAVETAANELVAARVTRHQPARKPPLAEVQQSIRDQLVAQKAAAAARQDGQAKLKAWQAAPKDAALDAALVLSRASVQTGQPQALVDAVMQAKTQPLPAWVGADLGEQGYVVARIDKVLPPDTRQLGDVQQVRQQYAQLWAQAESEAYYAALKDRFKAKIVAKPTATPANDAP